MKKFDFFLDTKIDFGRGSIKNISNHVKEYNGNKLLIVTEKILIEIGLVEKVIKALGNIEYVIYDKVMPNPTIEIVDQGVEFAKENKIDIVIAVGGGSSMDTAKAIAMLTADTGKCSQYLDGCKNSKMNIEKALPLIAIPTTSGTGSEVSCYSVILNESNFKDSLTSTLLYPRIAVIDVDLMVNLPREVIINTGLDVLGHALESYTAVTDNRFTDLFALEAIKIVFLQLERSLNKDNIEAKEDMAFASLIAGISMSHCGATIPHALGCALSGNLGLPHGLTVGVLQIPMIKFNQTELSEKYTTILKYINNGTDTATENATQELVDKMEVLFKTLDFQTNLEIPVSKEMYHKIVSDSMIHGCIQANRKTVSLENIKELFKTILQIV